MRKNPHVRICGGLGSATTLVYPTPCQSPSPAYSIWWSIVFSRQPDGDYYTGVNAAGV